MPSVVLVYNEEETDNAKIAQDAEAVHSVLNEYDRWLRSEVKHNTNISEEERCAYDNARTKLHDLLDEDNVSWWLYS